MINIVAHRGLWNKVDEQNTIVSIQEAFQKGFHCEIDLIEYNNMVICAHDESSINESYLRPQELYKFNNNELLFFLDIKSDISPQVLKPHCTPSCYYINIKKNKREIYHEKGLKTLISLNANVESLPNARFGFLLDFWKETLNYNKVIELFQSNKKILLIISPEIHSINPTPLWKILKNKLLNKSDKTFLCTDYPEKAYHFFKSI